jgi:hypothetical protein
MMLQPGISWFAGYRYRNAIALRNLKNMGPKDFMELQGVLCLLALEVKDKKQ